MLSPRWHKVLADLWGNKTRTLLVVLSIAVGLTALGMVSTSQIVLSRVMADSFAATNPASASLQTDPFEDELVQSVRRTPGVEEAEGRRSVTVRVRVGPEEWRNIQLGAIGDFNDMRIGKVWHEAGSWPPSKHEALIERGSMDFLKVQIGDTVEIETASGERKELRIAGRVHDLGVPSAFWAGAGYGYINLDTLEWLDGTRLLNELKVVVTENKLDKQHVQVVADNVKNKLEKSGLTVYATQVPDPGKHWADSATQAMMMLMSSLAILSLLLSGFLVVNTVSALLAQQVRQIGIMKAIGGRNRQIMGIYLSTILFFGLLSLAVGVPAGAAAAYANSSFVAGMLNFNLTSFEVPLQVLAIQIAVGLVVPLLAALYPIISGTRITAREAMSSYGLGSGQFGRGLIDRMLEGLRGLSRPLLLSLRNTFRRRGRLVLTLTTLTMGGAIFIAVLSVQSSLLLTLDDSLEYWKYDVQMGFSRSYRVEQLVDEALRVPGVARAEAWGSAGARRLRADDSESINMYMVAPPAATQMLQPTILQGRWLLPDDEHAVVVNTEILREEPDIGVGDEIVLKVGERETTWEVVGIVKGVLTGPIAYANYPYFARVTREAGRARTLHVVTGGPAGTSHTEIAKSLEKHFESLGFDVASTEAVSEIRSRVEAQFDIIVIFLMIMAVLLGVVGGLGLMGTMSMNVLERTREIGVMRAIGASDMSVLQVFMVEGVLIGLLSWFAGAAAALPLSKLMSDAVGMGFMRQPLSYTFSSDGAALWVVIVVALAAIASFLPARRASKLTVREVLAYE